MKIILHEKFCIFTIVCFLLFPLALWGAEKTADTKAEEKKKTTKKEEEIEKDKEKKEEKKEKEEPTFMGMKKLQSYVPKAWKDKLKVGLEMRYRFEFHENKFDFNDATQGFDHDGFQLLRTRFNLDFKPVPVFRAFVQLQDSQLFSHTNPVVPNKNFYEDSFDVRQAYGDIILGIGGDKSLTLRIGRQQLAYGHERLIGGFNWNNVAQSFDAARAIFKAGDHQLDLFGARKVIIDRDGWNDWDENDDLLGLYFQTKMIKDHEIHAYYFFRDTDGRNVTPTPPTAPSTNFRSDVDESTIGFRIVGKPKTNPLDYTLEAAYQFGRAGSGANRGDISAYMVIAEVGYTFEKTMKPRLGLEINFASGDGNPLTGDQHTFDNLHPTNHLHYGFIDLASLQNLTDLIVHFSIKPKKGVVFKADLHFMWLDTSHDFSYHAGRGPRGFSGAANLTASEYLGTELDLVAKYQVNPFLGFLVGVSHFWTGDYHDARLGTKADNIEFFYFQGTLSF